MYTRHIILLYVGQQRAEMRKSAQTYNFSSLVCTQTHNIVNLIFCMMKVSICHIFAQFECFLLFLSGGDANLLIELSIRRWWVWSLEFAPDAAKIHEESSSSKATHHSHQEQHHTAHHRHQHTHWNTRNNSCYKLASVCGYSYLSTSLTAGLPDDSDGVPIDTEGVAMEGEVSVGSIAKILAHKYVHT